MLLNSQVDPGYYLLNNFITPNRQPDYYYFWKNTNQATVLLWLF
jgi:hypothetical protein